MDHNNEKIEIEFLREKIEKLEKLSNELLIENETLKKKLGDCINFLNSLNGTD